MPTYQEVITGAQANWPLQETSGLTASNEAGGPNAVLRVGLSFSNDSVTGPRAWLSNALTFAGGSQRASIPSPDSLSIGPEHSIALWVRVPPTQQNASAVLLDFGGTTNATFFQTLGGAFHFVTTRDSVMTSVDHPISTGGEWRHLVGTLASDRIALFVDGAQVAQTPVSASWDIAGTSDGAIGAADGLAWLGGSSFGATAGFVGDIAGVTVFARELSAAEAQALYLGPVPVAVETPSIGGPPRGARALVWSPGQWADPANGAIEYARTLEVSTDGVTGWSSLASVSDLTSTRLPLSCVDRHVRLREDASNIGGTASSYSTPAEVLPPSTPSYAVASSAHAAGVVAGQLVPVAEVSR